MPYGEENFKVAVLIYPNSFDSVVSVIFLIVESDGYERTKSIGSAFTALAKPPALVSHYG
jgi:hypothetical protein